MSLPPRLAVRLNEALGSEAAEDLVSWMDDMRADHAELRQEMLAMERRILENVEQIALATTAPIRADLRSLEKEVQALNTRIAEKHASLLTWPFGSARWAL